MTTMQISRCACRWCKDSSRYGYQNDLEAFLEQVLKSSGPFDDSSTVHDLALTCRDLLSALRDHRQGGI